MCVFILLLKSSTLYFGKTMAQVLTTYLESKLGSSGLELLIEYLSFGLGFPLEC